MIAQLPFGRTGHTSTRTLFGAVALANVGQDEADRTLELLLEHGVNHIDVAASYGDAELRVGPWMDQHRAQFFLATKTGERSYQAARDEIHRSLERLRVDQIDLIQLHNLVDEAEWEQAMAPGGALDAAIEARDQGLVRFIGVTGHGTQTPAMHRRSLERFPFDSVLLPYNYTMMQNAQYAADFETLLTLCQERGVAVQTIKAVARGPWHSDDHTYSPWYEPLAEQAAVDRAMHWVLARPGIFVNTLGEVRLLPKVLDAASRFEHAPTDDEMQADVAALAIEPLFT